MPKLNSLVNIKKLLVMGDSLSDRGTFDKRKLLGFIPLSVFSEVGYDSPRGRFTNGYVWGDYFVTALIEHFEIDYARNKFKLTHNARDNADIVDAILGDDLHFQRKNEKAFSLDNDKNILYKGERFARFYCEAGLTSYDYKTKFTFNVTDEATRLIVADLEEKRKLLAKDDKKYKICAQEKAETLILELSGANDLLTVNSEPTLVESDNAVNARIANLESLIQQGYRNFVLLNLPDLSLTPRFQAKSKAEQENVAKCTLYFNQQLAAKIEQVIEQYKGFNIPLNLSIFDVYSCFNEIYSHCEKYEFDKNKLKSPFIDSEEFKRDQENPIDKKEHISPADGYMFWDDIHPTMQTHTWLAIKFKQACNKIYKFMPPDSGKKGCKEAEDAIYQYTPESYAHLPVDVSKIIHAMYENAMSMDHSCSSLRRKKGELLKQFIFELKSQRGNLYEIDALIRSFTENNENMEIIKRHNNLVFDFFANKRTTQSEDYIMELAKVVEAHKSELRLSIN